MSHDDAAGEDLDLRRGRRLAIDVGSVRVGVAACDPDGILATPVETVDRVDGGVREDTADLNRIAALVEEYEAIQVIVGLPRTLRGEEGRAAESARAFAARLTRRIAPVPVVFADERFSTTVAQRSLRTAGIEARRQRDVVDQAAAVLILQSWLDSRRDARAAGERKG